tara:strand:- start:325 stop:1110 length:786 start_codon:yes stop_codon:yes gene_type:complete
MRPRWKTFFALATLAAFASLSSVPLEIAALSEVQSHVPWWAPVIAFAFGFVPSVIAVALGIGTLPATNFDLPIIKRLVDRQPVTGVAMRSILIRSVLFAVAGFVLVRVFSVWIEPLLVPTLAETARDQSRDTNTFSSLQLTLLSFAAGVREELVFRFGLMTLFTWIGIKLFAIPKANSLLIWTANLCAVIPFALVHSINAIGLGIPVTPGLIAVILLSNGAVGLLFGWLYARYGLVAAMTAHTVYDFIQFVIWPGLAESAL